MIAAFHRALEIRERTFGPEHPEVAMVLNNMGTLCMMCGRAAEAEQYFRRSLAIKEAVHGPGYPGNAGTWLNLGFLANRQGNLDKGESLIRRAADLLEAGGGGGTRLWVSVLSAHADVLNELGRTSEAAAIEAKLKAARR